MNFRHRFIVAIIIALILWGPIDHTWPAWLVIRLGYLLIVPLVCWWILKWSWGYFKPDAKSEETLERILYAIFSLTLWTFATLAATSKAHWDNTRWVRTHDGSEAVGDDILVKGPDIGLALMLAIGALAFLWFGVIRRTDKHLKNRSI